MSHKFVTVNWNKRKQVYDLCLWIGIVLYLAIFVAVSYSQFQGALAISPLIILIRAFSTCGFIMLTLILCIGPLARIDERFLPLLYNRRHFGVSFFIIALIHGGLATFWYHSFGDINPIVSIVTSGGDYQSLSDFEYQQGEESEPFQLFGLLALLIFFVMATTSHDYWNAALGQLWKTLHILVYPGYALLIVHIAFGALQEDNTGLLPIMVFASVIAVGGLHVYSALFCSRENNRIDSDPEWVEVGKWQDIENDRAIIVGVGNDERVAIFRYYNNKLCAVSNVCQHQNGPLGEGKVIDGCITCPWHGYQYRPQDGCSPPPFTEKIETYQLKLQGDMISLNPKALPAGTARPITEIPLSANQNIGNEHADKAM